MNQNINFFTRNRLLFSQLHYSTSIRLKDTLANNIFEHNKKVANFRQTHGATVIQNVTIDMIYGGMRSMKALICETSDLDQDEGIRFRGYTIPEIQKLLPKAENGDEPLPEGIWWLLLTGEIPTADQVQEVNKEWVKRAEVPEHVIKMMKTFPKNLHPMSQLVSAIAGLSSESKFAKAYEKGLKKIDYWEYVYEDAMDLLARLPTVAAMIYRNLYRDGESVGGIGTSIIFF